MIDFVRSIGVHAAAVTASDTATLDSPATLYVGTSGNIKILTAGGETVTFASFSGFLPVVVKQVFDTDTTASNIVALW